jgi:hypothetical protein
MNAAASMSVNTPPAHALASKRLVVIGFILTTIFTSVVGGVVSCAINDHQTTREEKIKEVNSFLGSMDAFEPLMRIHVRNIVAAGDTGKSADIEKSKEALLANIQQQHILLRRVEPFVPSDLKFEAQNYADTLVKLSDELNAADSPLTAAPLMQQLNDTVLAKRKLTGALREGVGLSG